MSVAFACLGLGRRKYVRFKCCLGVSVTPHDAKGKLGGEPVGYLHRNMHMLQIIGYEIFEETGTIKVYLYEGRHL